MPCIWMFFTSLEKTTFSTTCYNTPITTIQQHAYTFVIARRRRKDGFAAEAAPTKGCHVSGIV